ncbi:MAG: cytochrome P450 [Sphingomonadales bacterium]|nr:MAG: cytochrome P450 [Sphingomonadales bacterium]
MELHGGETRLDPLIRNNPFPFYRALRKEQPVYYDPGLDVYLVTRYDDLMTVLRDDDTFSVEQGYQDRWGGDHLAELTEILERDGGGLIRDPMYDPPLHTRYRKLIEKAFTAHRVKTLEPRIRQIVVDILEPLIERGHADGRKDIGVPLTARIMCDQLGFDFDEVGAEKIEGWSNAIIAQMGRMQTREGMIENARDICEMQNYIIRQIEARQDQPTEDMTSDLVHASLEDGTKLNRTEQIAWVRALLVGGGDTTTAALSNLLMIIATQPELAKQLRDSADDDRMLTRFVEEVLRLEPPAHGLFRTARRDVELGGVKIPAGAQICTLFASANDDDSKFPCPRDLDPNRNNLASHLTFGTGIHRCVAASLARMEVKVAAYEIIKRMDDIKRAIPVEELTYLPTLGTQTLERLPLTFTRRS